MQFSWLSLGRQLSMGRTGKAVVHGYKSEKAVVHGQAWEGSCRLGTRLTRGVTSLLYRQPL